MWFDVSLEQDYLKANLFGSRLETNLQSRAAGGSLAEVHTLRWIPGVSSLQGTGREIGARYAVIQPLMELGMASQGIPYKQMTPGQKFRFIVKLTVCILSFGMLFPNVMSD